MAPDKSRKGAEPSPLEFTGVCKDDDKKEKGQRAAVVTPSRQRYAKRIREEVSTASCKKTNSGDEDLASATTNSPLEFRNLDGSVSKPRSLSDLPSDVLGEIFCRLSCENILLGAVAKVNRAFRKIALEPHTIKCVQENFVQAHKKGCYRCTTISDEGSASFDDLLFAVRSGFLSCVKYISHITNGKFSHLTDINGNNVLHVAASGGDIDIIRYFVSERGATDLITDANFNGESVLHLAAYNGCIDVVRYFISERGDTDLITAINDFGDTALHLAARNGHIDIVRYFISERGATDLLAEINDNGDTALDVAKERNNREVVEYLESRM